MGQRMDTQMETYYWSLVSHTGRFLTLQMMWWTGRTKIQVGVVQCYY